MKLKYNKTNIYISTLKLIQNLNVINFIFTCNNEVVALILSKSFNILLTVL